MPEKQKTESWKNPKTIIAAVFITTLVGLWNTFATRDRGETGDIDVIATAPSVTPESTADTGCPTPTPAQNVGKKCPPLTHTRSS